MKIKERALVGSAGKKLSLAIEDAGISRDSVYITNIVKCRPPNNRVPTNEESRNVHRIWSQRYH